MLTVDFKLQPTGVLTRLPAYANRDVMRATVTVFRDALGQISETPTETTDNVTRGERDVSLEPQSALG